jgi:hypothetical protein
MGYLLALELAPTFTLETEIKFLQTRQIQEIDESVPDIAIILDIAGQVEEVVGIGMLLIDLLSQQLDGVLVGYVLDHERSPSIQADPIGIDLEVERVQLPQPLAIVVVGQVD